MAFTGSILRELNRGGGSVGPVHMGAGMGMNLLGGGVANPLGIGASPLLDQLRAGAPLALVVDAGSHRFLQAQAAVLDAVAQLLARLGLAAECDVVTSTVTGGPSRACVLISCQSVASAAVLSAELAAAAAAASSAPASAATAATTAAAAAVSAAPPVVVSGVLVAQSLLKPAHASLRSPTLAIDSWKNLIGLLKTAVANASKALPYAAGVALAATAAAIALHVLTVRLPDWRRYFEARNSTVTEIPDASPRADPARMDFADLTAEVTALRAEIDTYRAGALAPKQKELMNSAYAEASEAQIRSLEHANAILKDNVSALAKELKIRERSAAMIQELDNALQNERSSVQNLLWEVESLKAEKDTQERRVKNLENNLEELRVLFEGIRSRPTSRASSRLGSSSSLAVTGNGFTSGSGGGRTAINSASEEVGLNQDQIIDLVDVDLATEKSVSPLIPVLHVRNLRLSDEITSNGAAGSQTNAGAVGGDILSETDADAGWESI
ncbi:hypothetical protein HK100_008025 [Physocladia obscura]|uniref:Uncharacterized protein n=1 Tax=Physocladia obscura TaxID=109957 RepID=A0AAD5SU93_9FUNG|nr:hypothetical protein HK100_008025 [Physocladia obscura]